MKTLREEINQSKFKSPLEMAIVNLLYTSNWFRDIQTPIFKKHSVQTQHYNVLKIVKGRYPKPASPGDILKVMLDKGRDLTRLVDKLVKLGYLQRQTCPTNRRKVDIFMTEKGLEQTKLMEQEMETLLVSFNSLNNEEAEQLSYLLDKIRN